MLQDMGVDHRCRHIIVPEQLLNGADVRAALQQMRGKRMALMPSRGAVHGQNPCHFSHLHFSSMYAYAA
jgi:hypothetical protein